MGLEVIGAGLGRTGTLSLRAALERLGYGPCYHGIDVLRSPERASDWRPIDGRHNWDVIFRGYRATVDWPAAAFWRELADGYPSAKVLLSVRDFDSWYESMMSTVFQSTTTAAPSGTPEPLREFREMLTELVFERTFSGRFSDRAHSKRVFERHNQEVVEAVSRSRLLVYGVRDGWEPLCRFLGVPVPAEPFPHLNDRAWYRAAVGLDPKRRAILKQSGRSE